MSAGILALLLLLWHILKVIFVVIVGWYIVTAVIGFIFTVIGLWFVYLLFRSK